MFLESILYFLGKLTFFTGAIINQNSFPKPLTEEEEKKYLLKAKNGEKEAKDKLIEHNLRLVAHIVKKYNGVAETDDLISVGSIGLIKAVNTYDYDKGTGLATYTARCIENEILMLIRANKKSKNNVSLNDAVGFDKDGNELNLIDLIFDNEKGVIDKVEDKILKDKLLKIIQNTLTKREFTIICLRFGLKGTRPFAQREVAKFLKISRSYISRIEKKSIEKIRAVLKREDFY